MDTTITATVVVAGMIFSLTIALLLEELLFGLVFRLMACSRRIAAAIDAKQIRNVPIVTREGEQTCSR
jgi:hypothetical protein